MTFQIPSATARHPGVLAGRGIGRHLEVPQAPVGIGVLQRPLDLAHVHGRVVLAGDEQKPIEVRDPYLVSRRHRITVSAWFIRPQSHGPGSSRTINRSDGSRPEGTDRGSWWTSVTMRSPSSTRPTRRASCGGSRCDMMATTTGPEVTEMRVSRRSSNAVGADLDPGVVRSIHLTGPGSTSDVLSDQESPSQPPPSSCAQPRTTMTVHRGPGARARRPSAVTSGTSSASATAT